MDIDSGAAVTLMSQNVHFPKAKLTLLKIYTGERIPVEGEREVTVRCGNYVGTQTLYVVKGNGPTLFGRD